MDSVQNTMEFYPEFIGILQELFKHPIKIQWGIPSASKRDSISNAVGFHMDSIEIPLRILYGFKEILQEHIRGFHMDSLRFL